MLNIIGVPEDIDIKKEFPVIRFEFADCDLSPEDKSLLRKKGIVIEGLMTGEIKPVMFDENKLNNYKRIWESYVRAYEEEKKASRESHLLTPSQREQYLNSRPLELNSSLITTDSSSINPSSTEERRYRSCPGCHEAGYDCSKCGGIGLITYEESN
ncbi:MAG: hypothetical protein JO360_07125 [Acidobacteria bacterium]|nr:hypothetical protein [Acidobacteriota bacterium]